MTRGLLAAALVLTFAGCRSPRAPLAETADASSTGADAANPGAAPDGGGAADLLLPADLPGSEAEVSGDGGAGDAAPRPPDATPPDAATTDGGGALARFEILDLEVEHLAPDPGRGRLYATVAGAAPAYANRLLFIDTATFQVVDSLAVGSNPGELALSADGSTLWIGVDGLWAIRRLDLTTTPPTLGPVMRLPRPSTAYAYAAGPMVILPGTSRSLAVSLSRMDVSPSFGGVYVLDDGVPRMQGTDDHTGSGSLIAGPPGVLFGMDPNLDYDLWVLHVSAAGVTQTRHEKVFSMWGRGMIHVDGRLYTPSGEVVDVSDPDRPRPGGTFAARGSLIAQPGNRILVLTSADPDANQPDAILRVLDTRTLRLSTSFRMLPGVVAWPPVQARADTIAFISPSLADRVRKRLAFLRDPLIAGDAP
jgi:hypothetical protein